MKKTLSMLGMRSSVSVIVWRIVAVALMAVAYVVWPRAFDPIVLRCFISMACIVCAAIIINKTEGSR